MNRRYVNLALILFLLIVSIYVDSGSTIPILNKSLPTVLGLDLRGGTQALLEVDLPATTAVTSQQMADARQILEGRINGLGVTEAVVQVAGERRMVVEIPGLTNPDEVITIIKETGLLEFVDLGSTPLPVGTTIVTDFNSGGLSSPTPTATAAVTSTAEPTPGPGTPTAGPTASPTPVTIYHTVLTGDQLSSVNVSTSTVGAYVINFTLKAGPKGADLFATYTRDNVGKILAIVLDKKVISAPSINGEIPNGSGQITGTFTYDEANNLAIQMRYGSLPVPLKVVQSQVIGPTLGKDSLDKSILAGIIGFLIVTLFMIIYYRLPGILAVLSILTYALITLALFKIIPVTLTLPGIAGFLLSTGGALDANILIFERMKEELRGGRTLGNAIELGWRRAWPSIRDLNIATLITSLILYWFGSSFGATIVKGFAVTLFLGVLISLFCAIVVTRTFLGLTLNFLNNPSERLSWFGL